ncbi:MAG: glutaredoxin family protein [Petrotogales bacterium]
MEHVEGENKGNVMLYAISTCGWCKKTKKLLRNLGVAYNFVDMDLLDDDEKKEVEKEVKECNPKLTYPTLKVNDDCILGFKEDKIKEALE